MRFDALRKKDRSFFATGELASMALSLNMPSMGKFLQDNMVIGCSPLVSLPHQKRSLVAYLHVASRPVHLLAARRSAAGGKEVNEKYRWIACFSASSKTAFPARRARMAHGLAAKSLAFYISGACHVGISILAAFDFAWFISVRPVSYGIGCD
ncbi:MAG: hypothetical protein K8T91_05565, partial [Planctomycetes bacterium]|nr:hypothetical protein [Planctomycetota bacterium]